MTTRVSQRVRRSASLNETRKDSRISEREPGSGVVIRGTTISFSSTNTIADSANGLGQLAVGARICVRGSPLNSRDFEVATSAAGSITVIPAQVQTEAAGGPIEIVREG